MSTTKNNTDMKKGTVGSEKGTGGADKNTRGNLMPEKDTKADKLKDTRMEKDAPAKGTNSGTKENQQPNKNR